MPKAASHLLTHLEALRASRASSFGEGTQAVVVEDGSAVQSVVEEEIVGDGATIKVVEAAEDNDIREDSLIEQGTEQQVVAEVVGENLGGELGEVEPSGVGVEVLILSSEEDDDAILKWNVVMMLR